MGSWCLGLWWLASALGATLEITVPDPSVVTLILECANGSYRADVKGGVALFDHLPNNCRVYMIRRAGLVNEPGKWTCLAETCSQEEILHQEVVDAPGRLNIVLASEMPKGSSFELTCPGGYRTRADIAINTAVFEGVPSSGDCTLFFKGNTPARFNGISPGTWSCGILGSTAVCQKK